MPTFCSPLHYWIMDKIKSRPTFVSCQTSCFRWKCMVMQDLSTMQNPRKLHYSEYTLSNESILINVFFLNYKSYNTRESKMLKYTFPFFSHWVKKSSSQKNITINEQCHIMEVNWLANAVLHHYDNVTVRWESN